MSTPPSNTPTGAAPASPAEARAQRLERLRSEPIELLVVGGGATGAAIARDAAIRGVKVALVEQRDFAWGTSSRSSKLIHGGLRYLEQLQFGMVFEGTRERWVLSRVAPHLVWPLPFVYPVYGGASSGMFKISVGMMLYDALAAFRNHKRHRMLRSARLRELEPQILPTDLRGGALYYDATTFDARLVLAHVDDAEHHGAICLNRVAFEGVIHESERAVGARLRDLEGDAQLAVEVGRVVLAAGPQTDAARTTSGIQGAPLIRATKGAHIVVASERLPVRHAVVMAHPRDRRVTFAIPWGETTLVGTTDTDFSGDPTQVEATLEDVDYLLEAVATYFPRCLVGHDDVRSAWAGLRPLVREEGASEYETSREHEIFESPSGVLTLCGGKLTTCRKMAEEIVDRYADALPAAERARLGPCLTADQPVRGGEQLQGFDDVERLVRTVAAEAGVSEASARELVRSYGSRVPDMLRGVLGRPGALEPLCDGLATVWGQVEVAIDDEQARSTADVLRRRTMVFYRAADQGVEAAGRVSRRLAARLGWSDAERAADLAAYVAEVDASRAWRAPASSPPRATDDTHGAAAGGP